MNVQKQSNSKQSNHMSHSVSAKVSALVRDDLLLLLLLLLLSFMASLWTCSPIMTLGAGAIFKSY